MLLGELVETNLADGDYPGQADDRAECPVLDGVRFTTGPPAAITKLEGGSLP